MLTQVALNRDAGEGKYGDVIDVAEHLAATYGSATNALYQIAKESPLFEKGKRELERGAKADPETLAPVADAKGKAKAGAKS